MVFEHGEAYFIADIFTIPKELKQVFVCNVAIGLCLSTSKLEQKCLDHLLYLIVLDVFKLNAPKQISINPLGWLSILQ